MSVSSMLGETVQAAPHRIAPPLGRAHQSPHLNAGFQLLSAPPPSESLLRFVSASAASSHIISSASGSRERLSPASCGFTNRRFGFPRETPKSIVPLSKARSHTVFPACPARALNTPRCHTPSSDSISTVLSFTFSAIPPEILRRRRDAGCLLKTISVDQQKSCGNVRRCSRSGWYCAAETGVGALSRERRARLRLVSAALPNSAL
ncbi:hypothetical protein T484DRAFT_2429575 [Baffinella frigidus]|nr:hypothetical protein T484DRAFT_2429575 [Cryptophyta sp. CCMP2293]